MRGGRPNKYLTKSSGKLIPSFGRFLRGAPSTAAPSTRSSGSVLFHSAIYLVRFRERIGRNHDPGKTVTSAENAGMLPEPRILLAFIQPVELTLRDRFQYVCFILFKRRREQIKQLIFFRKTKIIYVQYI